MLNTKSFPVILALVLSIVLFGCTSAPKNNQSDSFFDVNVELNVTPINQSNESINSTTRPTLNESNLTLEDSNTTLPNCVDGDRGLDPSSQSNVTYGQNTSADFCINSQTVLEYGCLDNKQVNASILCGASQVCRDGACRASLSNSTACFGPTNYSVLISQNISYKGVTYKDSCADWRTVKKYYCKPNGFDSVNDECPIGYGCSGGQCSPLPSQCQDSDGGINLSNRGRVLVMRGLSTLMDEWDSCYDEMKITEYFCLQNGSGTYQNSSCQSGNKCLDGRCVRSSCSETDGGNNSYVPGATTDRQGTSRDSCIDSSTLLEYYCYGDYADSETITCDPGYTCKDSICTPANSTR
ncbi:hypothetical protein HZC07_05840 [Candidatus Micrarchaeota archaeon]|nr:hypothetical protein [Candidatus Micrarchaeota archaeon]